MNAVTFFIVLVAVIFAGIILGRLTAKVFLNTLLGGVLFKWQK